MDLLLFYLTIFPMHLQQLAQLTFFPLHMLKFINVLVEFSESLSQLIFLDLTGVFNQLLLVVQLGETALD